MDCDTMYSDDDTDCSDAAKEDDVLTIESFVNFKLEDTALILPEIAFSSDEETWDIAAYKEDVAEFKLFCIETIDAAADAEFSFNVVYIWPKLWDIELDDILPIWE